MFFDSRRSAVLAKNGMVATSQPLAALAGLQMLMQGGNAVDAAVACAAALNVVEPESTGVGGDMFALIWNAQEKQVRALNGSGRAPAAASIDELKSAGHRQMPGEGTLFGLDPRHGSRLGNHPGGPRLHAPVRGPETGHPLRRGRLPGYRLYRPPVVGPASPAVRLALRPGNAAQRASAPSRRDDAPAYPGKRRCEPLPREAPTPFTTGKSPVKLPTLFRNRAVGLLPAIWLTTPPIGMKQLPPTTGESPAGSVRPTARVLPLWRRLILPRALTSGEWAPKRWIPTTT